MRKARSLVLVSVVASAWFAACGSDGESAGIADGDAGVTEDASGSGGRDATTGTDSATGERDATTADTSTDDGATDDGATNDGTTGDGAINDGGVDASDAADASDALDAAASDAADASDASDANDAADVVDAGPADANTSCVVAVFGDYYVRSDGSAVNGVSGSVVLDDANGQPLTGISQIVQETYSACALKSDHTVYCWPTSTSGNNGNGQLGNGTFVDVTDSGKLYHATRVKVANPDGGAALLLDNVTSMSTGSNYFYGSPICSIRSDKTLWCWGPTTQGSVFQGTTGSSSVDLAYATRIHMDTDAASGISNVDQVSSGGRHICYLSAGKVYCFGANIAGNLGTGDTTAHLYPVEVTLPSAATQVVAGGDITCAVVSGGQVYCWGTRNQSLTGNPVAPQQICNANFCHWLPTAVLNELADGGGGTSLDGITDLFMGYQFVCARDNVKALHCWGNSDHGTVNAARLFTSFASGSGVPSSPIASYTADGLGGYDSQLRYLTTNGVLVYGSAKKTPVCP